jgi:hypothetical protein
VTNLVWLAAAGLKYQNGGELRSERRDARAGDSAQSAKWLLCKNEK